jgi:hypothetical protein
VVEDEIDGRGAARIVANWNDLFEGQSLYDRFEIAQLLPEAIFRVRRFVGSAVTEKIERDDSSSTLIKAL